MKNGLLRTFAPVVAAGLVLVGCELPVQNFPTPPTLPPTSSGQAPAQPSIENINPGINAATHTRSMSVYINDNSDNENGFNLERKVGSGNFVSLVNLSPNTSLYDDSNITASTQYSYRVRAYNNSGHSNWFEAGPTTSVGPRSDTITLYPTADAFVGQGYASASSRDPIFPWDWNQLIVGGGAGEPIEYSYLLFPYNQIPASAKSISSATLSLKNWNTIGLYNPAAGVPLIAVQPLTRWSNQPVPPWNESVTWNNKPTGFGISSGYSSVNNTGSLISWDITSLVNYWFNGTLSNNGLELSLFSGQGRVVFDSRYSDSPPQLNYSSSPKLTIDYTW